ncbi:MAG: hypothetical protein LBF58_02160 [Deltaproteobacteria bacterium]|jgi:hypothetical protein|nr:hypothetical protein [Deltaproteobacteria bacterium]
MTSITYRTDKKSGQVYAYQSESYRDPETGKVKTRQKYLGIFDKQTGQIVSRQNRKIKQDNIKTMQNCLNNETEQVFNSKIVGPSMILDAISSNLPLLEQLKMVFPETYTDILSLVYYIVQVGGSLPNCMLWSKLYDHPSKKDYTSKDIAKLINNISPDEINLFLNSWLKNFIDTEYLCYDITSISSYDTSTDFLASNLDLSNKNISQINLALLFGQQSKLPAFYVSNQGNINNLQTLDSINKQFYMLKKKDIRFIFNEGFYSQNNVDDILSKTNHHFILATPDRHKWLEKIIDENSDSVRIPSNFYVLDDIRIFYAKTQLYKWPNSNKDIYLHLYYNDIRPMNDYNQLITDLHSFKEYLTISNQYIPDNNYLYKFLNITYDSDNCLEITYNYEKLLEYKNKYAGYFCILSSFIDDSTEAFLLYERRDIIDNYFRNINQDIYHYQDLETTFHFDLDIITVKTTPRLDAKIFLHFLALIFNAKIIDLLSKDDRFQYLSPKELLDRMATLRQANIGGSDKNFYTEADGFQITVLEYFGLKWPNGCPNE